MDAKKGVLFVCLGNICRSPIAEAVFLDLLKQRNIADDWFVDSAALNDRHVGNLPDSRATLTLKKHGIVYKKRARLIEDDDFMRYDFIFGMDENNIADLNCRAPKDCKAKILLLGDFDPNGQRIIRNICRSPIAEGVFLDIIKQRNIANDWFVDSAALGGWHVGNPPDSRAMTTMKKHNIVYKNRARQIEDDDFNTYDFIFGMDENNIANLKREAPKNCKAKILLLGDFDPEGQRIIRDPYYDSGSEGFETCYQQCLRSCNAFLDKLRTGSV